MNASMMTPTVGTFRREMDRLLDRFWEGDGFSGPGEWTPAMDLSESKDSLIVRIDVPGLEAKDVHVTLENGVLMVRGEKARETENRNERHYRIERAYGSFVRGISLPATVDSNKTEAVFKNGVLTVTMPKGPGARGADIPVKT